MKKIILLLGLLVGCAPGLTATRVEGISAYTTASNKLAEVEQLVKTQADPAFSSNPGWKLIDARNHTALIELKYSLAQHNEVEVKNASKEVKTAVSLLAMPHVGALYRIFALTKTTLPFYESNLKKYGLTTDTAWVAARNHLVVVSTQLASAAVGTDEELLKNRTDEFYKAYNQLQDTYYTIVSVAETKEACSHIRCPSDTVCHFQFGQVACIDEKTNKRVMPETLDHVNKGPVHAPDTLPRTPLTK